MLEALEPGTAAVIFSGDWTIKSADRYHTFSVDRDFYYLTGVNEGDCALLLVKGATASEVFALAKRHSGRDRLYDGRGAEGQALAQIGPVMYLDKLEAYLARLVDRGAVSTLALDCINSRPARAYTALLAWARGRHPWLPLQNLSPHIHRMRQRKATHELDGIRQAIDITDEALRRILGALRPGISECEIHGHFDFVNRCRGGRGHGINTIVASGQNALILHYTQNNRTTQAGDMVLLDLGGDYQYYNADISRTYPVSGRFSPKQRYYYEAVLESQLEVIAALRPGFLWADARGIANRVLARYAQADGVLQSADEMQRLLPHGIGHPLGLDVHDGGCGFDGLLEPGMVMTVEPGIYLQEYGFGIRIEDDVLITENGCQVLSQQIEKQPDEIERLIRG